MAVWDVAAAEAAAWAALLQRDLPVIVSVLPVDIESRIREVSRV